MGTKRLGSDDGALNDKRPRRDSPLEDAKRFGDQEIGRVSARSDHRQPDRYDRDRLEGAVQREPRIRADQQLPGRL